MPENRYKEKLRRGNQLIIDLIPGNNVLRIELALELKKITQSKNNLKMLEIGIGEGDLTKHILDNTKDIQIDCLDISKEMLEVARKNLSQYSHRLNFICEDALDFLSKASSEYDIIVSAWTIHNFLWKDKVAVFEKIVSSLKPEGKFLLMDKVYPDSTEKSTLLLDLQLKRYRYLESDLAEEIINHERQDLLEAYRMDLSPTITSLKNAGLSSIEVVDTVERDVLLVAEK